jgi:hypothetical protein
VIRASIADALATRANGPSENDLTGTSQPGSLEI